MDFNVKKKMFGTSSAFHLNSTGINEYQLNLHTCVCVHIHNILCIFIDLNIYDESSNYKDCRHDVVDGLVMCYVSRHCF